MQRPRPGRWAPCLAALVLALACGEPGGAPPAPETVAPPAEPASLSFEGDAAGIRRMVVVSIDTLRADHVGCYGAEQARTPVIDALAEAGVRFETAIAPTPMTLPSHSTLLTGLDPPQHGARHNGVFRLAEEIPTLAEAAREAGFATGAFVSAYVLDRQFGLAQGFDRYDDELGASTRTHAGPTVPTRDATGTVDAALGWVAEAPERFLLFLHLYDPHADHEPPEPYASQLGAANLYDGEIAYADAEVGRLLAGIAERWPTGTLVVVTSDHGEAMGEHGEFTHSLGIYDATQHVPLVVAGPGVPGAQVVPELVRLADVAPTLADLAALPLPKGTGRSLRGLWEGTPEPPRVAWVETLATQLDLGWSPLLGVRTATHKYIRAPRPELYALEEDPDELVDLASAEPALVRELDAAVSEREKGRPIELTTDLSSDERAQLEALGYVTEGPEVARGELGIIGGIDPKDEIHLLEDLFQGMNLLARRRYDAAFEKFDAIGDRSYELALLRGQAALGAQRFEAAVEAALGAARFGPTRGNPEVLLGQIAETVGQASAATRRYRRALELEPSQGAASIGLGRLAELAGRRDEARSHYEAATRARIFEAEAVWRLAALDLEDGDTASSRERLTTLPQSELRQPPAASRLARAELTAGKGELARIRVAGGLRTDPENLYLLLMHAVFLELDGDPGGALRASRDAARAHPRSLKARQALARQLARHRTDPSEAGALAATVLEAVGREPVVLDTLALVRLAEDRPAEALALADEGLQNGEGETRASLLLRRAEALASLERADEAQKALDEARIAARGSVELEADARRTAGRIAALLGAGEEQAAAGTR